MPQFDFMSFPVQIFWITVLIYTMHLVYMYFFLPHTSSVLKFRERIVSKNAITSAEQLYKVWDKSFSAVKRNK